MKTSLVPPALLAALIVLPALPCRARTTASDHCGQIARAGRNACDNDTRETYWIALGNCANLADDAGRRTCRKGAQDAAAEGRRDCRDQLDARQALCDRLGPEVYAPALDPARFLTPQAAAANPNPLFPLKPGHTWIYQGGDETTTVIVTDQTRTIAGIVAFVVSDVVRVGGQVKESTLDYFAQDVDGTVWYLGESVQNFDGADLVGTDGSFLHGRAAAFGGVIMPAAPHVGDVYRQEFALGEAEDAAEVLSIGASESVPGASCNGTCLETRDFSPLDPGADEHKLYAPGIGVILEVDVDDGLRTELQSFTPGP